MNEALSHGYAGFRRVYDGQEAEECGAQFCARERRKGPVETRRWESSRNEAENGRSAGGIRGMNATWAGEKYVESCC